MPRLKIIAVFYVVLVVSSAFVLFGLVQTLHNTASKQVRFKSWTANRSGLVLDFRSFESLAATVPGIMNSTALLVYTGPLPGSNYSSLREISSAEGNGTIVLYEITGDQPALQVNDAASMGFQGVFLSGKPGDYGSAGLDNLVNLTSKLNAFLMVNSSLSAELPVNTNASAYYRFEQNYTTWINQVRLGGLTNMTGKNYWVNIQTVQANFLQSAVRISKAFDIRYISMGLGNISSTLLRSIISLENGNTTATGIIPSSWSVSSFPYFASPIVYDGTVYLATSNLLPLDALLNVTSHGILNYSIVGLNLTYGYVSFSSSQASIVNPFVNAYPNSISSRLEVKSDTIYLELASLYLTNNSEVVGLYTDGFSLINGSQVSSLHNLYSAEPVYSLLPPQVFIASGFLVISFFELEVNQSYNRYQFNLYSADLLTGNVVFEKQLCTVSTPPNISGGAGWQEEVIDGSLFYASIQEGVGVNVTYATSSCLVNLQDNTTLLSSINTSLGRNFVLHGGDLFYTLQNASGKNGMWELNISTLQKRLLFSVNFTSISSITPMLSGFLFCENSTVVLVNTKGDPLWTSPQPVLDPSLMGYQLKPMQLGNNTILFASIINLENENTAYTQEFEFINGSNGAPFGSFFNNFTINSNGQPPGLFPEYHITYLPLAYAGNYLIYASMIGPPELFASPI